jgi:hypothetical protein
MKKLTQQEKLEEAKKFQEKIKRLEEIWREEDWEYNYAIRKGEKIRFSSYFFRHNVFYTASPERMQQCVDTIFDRVISAVERDEISLEIAQLFINTTRNKPNKYNDHCIQTPKGLIISHNKRCIASINKENHYQIDMQAFCNKLRKESKEKGKEEGIIEFTFTDVYEYMCNKHGAERVAKSRIRTIIKHLEMFKIIAKTEKYISGRTKDITEDSTIKNPGRVYIFVEYNFTKPEDFLNPKHIQSMKDVFKRGYENFQQEKETYNKENYEKLEKILEKIVEKEKKDFNRKGFNNNIFLTTFKEVLHEQNSIGIYNEKDLKSVYAMYGQQLRLAFNNRVKVYKRKPKVEEILAA